MRSTKEILSDLALDVELEGLTPEPLADVRVWVLDAEKCADWLAARPDLRGIETAYLNPLIPYVFAEHSLGDRDNVTMGLDLEVMKIRNIKLYGELFLDDLFAPWELFSDYWGNKVAFTLGGFWVNPIGLRDTEFRLEYTRLEPFVYTHHDTVNIFEHYNFCLGHFLQPNSDGLFLRMGHRFSLAVEGVLTFFTSRHGEGDRRTPHFEEDGTEKQFLSGVVEYQNRLGAQLAWEIFRDVRVRSEIARIWNKNNMHIPGEHKKWTELVCAVNINW